jgi:hypothetical protein
MKDQHTADLLTEQEEIASRKIPKLYRRSGSKKLQNNDTYSRSGNKSNPYVQNST